MKHLLIALLAALIGSSVADTLDYGRYVAVITLSGVRTPGPEADGQLEARAHRILRAGAYDRDYTVGEFLAVHDRQARRLERMKLAQRRGAVRFASDGGTETDYEFPLTGAVMEQLLPVPEPKRLLGRVACPCCGREWPEGQPVPDDLALIPYEAEEAPMFTGVLVDVRGLEFRPAFFPRIVTDAGAEVFGPAFADEDAVVTGGLAGYYRDRGQALLEGRPGSNPLVVRALAVEGRNRCEAVVTDADAALIHGSQRSLANLARCRVGFLTD